MKCWNCGKDLPDLAWGKVPFRETCDHCHAALHCCRNCVHYHPGKPNDCEVPNTDFVADRTAVNFCEDFKLSGKGPAKSGDINEASKRLFGDDDNPKPKKGFDSLFND